MGLVGNQYDLVRAAQFILELERGRETANASAQYDDGAHFLLSFEQSCCGTFESCFIYLTFIRPY
jgi:hypothetical protein